jgi:DnaJ-class molecular chaperone
MEIGINEIILIIIIIYYAYCIDRFLRKRKSHFEEYTKTDENRNQREMDLKEEDEQDPYKILNIGRNATKDELTSAYRKLVKIYHPDRVAGLAPEYREIAERKMKIINAAYRRLKETIK